jgi:hypothetical protein
VDGDFDDTKDIFAKLGVELLDVGDREIVDTEVITLGGR